MDRVNVGIESRLDLQNQLSILAQVINSDAFTSVISLAPGAVAATKAISGISQKIIDTFFSGGNSRPILDFQCTLNTIPGDLEDAYYVILGTADTSNPLPTPLPKPCELNVTESDLLWKNRPVTNLSYIVLDVTAVLARTRDLGRGQSWYNKLIDAEQRAMKISNNQSATKEMRENAYNQCLDLIGEASVLLQEDPLYLPSEATAITQKAYKDTRDQIFQKPQEPQEKPSITPKEVVLLRKTSSKPRGSGSLPESKQANVRMKTRRETAEIMQRAQKQKKQMVPREYKLLYSSLITPDVRSLLGVRSDRELTKAVNDYSETVKGARKKFLALGLLK